MRTGYGRSTAHVGTNQLRHDFVATVAGLVPDIGAHVETFALYVTVAAFWGLIAYLAVTFALQ